MQHSDFRIAIFTSVRVNTVKQALREGRVQFGCSCFQLRSPDAVRALAAAGLDWVFFDPYDRRDLALTVRRRLGTLLLTICSFAMTLFGMIAMSSPSV